MVGHRADRTNTASIRARILTSRSYACLRFWAVSVHKAFGLTSLVRITSVVRYALTNGRVESLIAVRVYSAW